MRFYTFITQRENDPLYAKYAKIARTMPKFPVANRDKQTIKSAIRRYQGDAFNEIVFDKIWEDYRQADGVERLMGMLPR